MAKYSKAAQKNVESAMKKMEKGTLRRGKSNKKVTNPKQAIAIGLSEAREKGAKVPTKKTTKKAVKKAAPNKTVSKKAVPKKVAAAKKVTPIKKAAPKKKTPTKKVSQSRISKKDINEIAPVETFASKNLDLPPVEEKSPEVKSVIPGKVEDPILVTDKKALAKAVTKNDPKHHIQLSGPKHSIRPSGKKPLWR